MTKNYVENPEPKTYKLGENFFPFGERGIRKFLTDSIESPEFGLERVGVGRVILDSLEGIGGGGTWMVREQDGGTRLTKVQLPEDPYRFSVSVDPQGYGAILGVECVVRVGRREVRGANLSVNPFEDGLMFTEWWTAGERLKGTSDLVVSGRNRSLQKIRLRFEEIK